MLSSDFLFPRFLVVPLANPSNFSHCKCFSSRIIIIVAYNDARLHVYISSTLQLLILLWASFRFSGNKIIMTHLCRSTAARL